MKYKISMSAYVVWIFICILVIAIYVSFKRQEWLDTHCVVIGKTSGSTSFGVMSNGNVGTFFVLGKTSYQCNDGKFYNE